MAPAATRAPLARFSGARRHRARRAGHRLFSAGGLNGCPAFLRCSFSCSSKTSANKLNKSSRSSGRSAGRPRRPSRRFLPADVRWANRIFAVSYSWRLARNQRTRVCLPRIPRARAEVARDYDASCRVTCKYASA
eukprot:15460514-Alexandrium_andersonii.AAC.1